MLQKRRLLGQILLLVILSGLCSLTAVRIYQPCATGYPTEHPTVLGAKYSGNDFAGAKSFSPLADISKAIASDQVGSDTAVIYPIILPDRLEVIFALPGHPLSRTSILEPKETIETTIRQMRNSLRRTSFLEERLPLAQKLYDWLIRPVADDLASDKIKTLVFVLDGPLRNVPMAALHDGQQYLVEKYAIAINPSLQLLAEGRSSLRPEKIKALLGGLSEATQGFSPLPAVD